jgi:hypothetical protein
MNNKPSLDRPVVILLTTFIASFACVNCNMDESTQKAGEEKSNSRSMSEHAQALTDTGRTSPSDENTKQMRVFIDPETGEMRSPTHQESEALNKSIPQRQPGKTSEPQPIVHPDGSVSIQLDESHIKNTIVEVCKDGSLSANCLSIEK